MHQMFSVSGCGESATTRTRTNATAAAASAKPSAETTVEYNEHRQFRWLGLASLKQLRLPSSTRPDAALSAAELTPVDRQW